MTIDELNILHQKTHIYAFTGEVFDQWPAIYAVLKAAEKEVGLRIAPDFSPLARAVRALSPCSADDFIPAPGEATNGNKVSGGED